MNHCIVLQLLLRQVCGSCLAAMLAVITSWSYDFLYNKFISFLFSDSFGSVSASFPLCRAAWNNILVIWMTFTAAFCVFYSCKAIHMRLLLDRSELAIDAKHQSRCFTLLALKLLQRLCRMHEKHIASMGKGVPL